MKAILLILITWNTGSHRQFQYPMESIKECHESVRQAQISSPNLPIGSKEDPNPIVTMVCVGQ